MSKILIFFFQYVQRLPAYVKHFAVSVLYFVWVYMSLLLGLMDTHALKFEVSVLTKLPYLFCIQSTNSSRTRSKKTVGAGNPETKTENAKSTQQVEKEK